MTDEIHSTLIQGPLIGRVVGVTPWIAPKPIADAPKDRTILAWCVRWRCWMVGRIWSNGEHFSASVGENCQFSCFYDLPEDVK